MESIGKAYKPWLIASAAALVGGLLLLAFVGTMAFVNSAKGMPLWLLLLGVVAALGIAVGFGGMFLILAMAGWTSFKESRRVQVIPPGRGDTR